MTSILFIIPTLLTPDRIPRLSAGVQALRRQCRASEIDGRIVVLSGGTPEFLTLNIPGVEKVVVPDMYHQVATINCGINQHRGEDFICFIHDDIEVLDDHWMRSFISHAIDRELNVGILGLQEHTDSFLRDLGPIEKHVWVDGVMFFAPSLLNEIGMFDEKFTNDCSEQDFSLRAMEEGYRNYKVKIPFKHTQTPFIYKYGKDMSRQVKRSRKAFAKKWDGKIIFSGSDTVHMKTREGWFRKILNLVKTGGR